MNVTVINEIVGYCYDLNIGEAVLRVSFITAVAIRTVIV